MAWYRNSRFVYNALKLNLRSKTFGTIPTPRVHSNSSSLFYNQSTNKCSGLFGSAKSGYFNGFKHHQEISSFSGFARRNYHGDKTEVSAESLLEKLLLLAVALILIAYRHVHPVVVPYTGRKHYVLMSTTRENENGEVEKRKIQPATHPDTERVRSIFQHIIESLEREINHHELELERDETFKEKTIWKEETVDDKDSRKKHSGAKITTNHLEGLNWEIFVVDKPLVESSCLFDGKIVVYTGLLNHFNSDAELATIIAHQVGHAVARHEAEHWTALFWWSMLGFYVTLFEILFTAPEFANARSKLLLRHPLLQKVWKIIQARFHQLLPRTTLRLGFVGLSSLVFILYFGRKEIEADHIGVLLMASAGYDPRVAPQVYDKLAKPLGDWNCLATHPFARMRAKLLARADVMKEADKYTMKL
ncbi:mitochondrial metalloendopeptidase OMA1 [Beta vulgaris subsp. vulgaris]|uniref:mitochondrial metalloendopeptidase OMA1 n=1 Tax=Beta vulgaris subsp. vulgaris TaxID=3555 RepID=UPI002548FD29|nr:mitochondrial metalloendopeptidase OMA1 [Beta vulgaris subsp. vulgaris]